MSKITFAMTPVMTTAAEMQAWVQACITAMTNAGLVQTADTGQIGTIAALPAVGASAGYVIFRFNDSLASSYPIYIKVEFGSLGAVNKPNLWLTVGKGSNGAGTISGVLLPRAALGTSGASNTTSPGAVDGYACTGEGYAALIPAAAWTGSTLTGGGSVPGFFIIERSSDATGTPTGDGLTIVTSQQGGGGQTLATVTANALPYFHAINYASGVMNVGICPVVVPNKIQGVVLTGAQALAAGGIGPVFPWVAIAPTLAPWQCVSALSYPGGDNPGGAFQATLNGITRTYLAVPLTDNVCCFGVALSGASTTANSHYVGLALRWE